MTLYSMSRRYLESTTNVSMPNLCFFSLLVLTSVGIVYPQESFAIEGQVSSRPVAIGQLVVVGSDQGLYAYDLNLSKVVWTVNIAVEELYSANQYAIVSSSEETTVIDIDGNMLRTFPKSEVAVYLDYVYLMYDDGIHVFNTKGNFSAVRSFPLSDYALSGCSGLIVCNGEIIVNCGGRLTNLYTHSVLNVSQCQKLYNIKDRIICYNDYTVTFYSCDLDPVNSEYFEGEIIDYGSSEDGLFFTLSDNSLLLTDRQGNRIWKTQVPLVTRAANVDKYYIVGSKDEILYILDNHGYIRFEYPVDDWPCLLYTSPSPRD